MNLFRLIFSLFLSFVVSQSYNNVMAAAASATADRTEEKKTAVATGTADRTEEKKTAVATGTAGHTEEKKETAPCTICMEENDKDSVSIPCHHTFHQACLDGWRATGKQTCPNCRHDPQSDNFKTAIEQNDYDKASAMIVANRSLANLIINPDTNETVLHRAAARGNFLLVRLLLHHGANRCRKNIYGEIPLHYASEAGQIKAARELSKQYAGRRSINSRDQYGMTPLHRAAQKRYYGTAAALIQMGANPNCTNYLNQETALHIASANGDPYTVFILLDARANIWLRDGNNLTAYETAFIHRRYHIMEIFQNHPHGINQPPQLIT